MTNPLDTQVTNWHAESVRLTVFLPPAVRVEDEGWWTKVTGASPENRIAKPARSELIETGILQGNVLTLSVQLGRIDWILAPNMASEAELGRLKTIGPVEIAENIFVSTISKWLKDCPPIVRLAYGVVLLEQVESRRAGYARIAQFVPAVRVDADSEDFFYQINRPRDSTSVRGVRLNRLSKWSVALFQPLAVSFGLPLNQPGQALMYSQGGPATMACRAEFDLSTVGIESELARDKLQPIFVELVSLASELSQRGDVP